MKLLQHLALRITPLAVLVWLTSTWGSCEMSVRYTLRVKWRIPYGIIFTVLLESYWIRTFRGLGSYISEVRTPSTSKLSVDICTARTSQYFEPDTICPQVEHPCLKYDCPCSRRPQKWLLMAPKRTNIAALLSRLPHLLLRSSYPPIFNLWADPARRERMYQYRKSHHHDAKTGPNWNDWMTFGNNGGNRSSSWWPVWQAFRTWVICVWCLQNQDFNLPDHGPAAEQRVNRYTKCIKINIEFIEETSSALLISILLFWTFVLGKQAFWIARYWCCELQEALRKRELQ